MAIFTPYHRYLICSVVLLVTAEDISCASAQMLTYQYSGVISEVNLNENNVIPDLSIGDSFSGYTTFESTGWHGTKGTVYAELNGVDLLFTGQSIYGEQALVPSVSYSIRIAADTGGSISGSTFSAGNFGPELQDTDGSAGIVTPFPSTFHLPDFELNIFRISGLVLGSGDRISATGQLRSIFLVPEPTNLLLLATMMIFSCTRRNGSFTERTSRL